MRKYYFIYVLSILKLILITSCNKDDQKFINGSINEVTIKTAAESYTIAQLDTLRIAPEVAESSSGSGKLKFEWRIYRQSQLGDLTQTVIGTEKNLASVIAVPPGNYYLRYQITDESNEASFFKLLKVSVTGAFSQGWYVSSNKDGKAMFSFIRSDDVIFQSPLESINGKSYPGKALATYPAVGSGMALVYFFTDKSVFRVNANDFVENGRGTDVMPYKTTDYVSKPFYGFNSRLAADQYIIAEGGLYAGIGPAFYSTEVTKPYSDRLAGDYSLFPGAFPSSQTATYFYDNKKQRFMQATYLGRDLLPCNATPSGSFDMANVGRTMIAYDAGVLSGTNHEYYFIMQSSNGRYFQSTLGPTPSINQLIASSPDINTATAFTSSTLVRQMYYASGNKIYLYDILANSSRLLYTFPEGYTIGDLKMLRATNKRIAAGVNNGRNGEVYYFEINSTGDFVSGTYAKKFTGFGEIVHLSYRN